MKNPTDSIEAPDCGRSSLALGSALKNAMKEIAEMFDEEGFPLCDFDLVKIETILKRNLADREMVRSAALTACHSAMLGKVNPKHPAWGVLYAAQDSDLPNEKITQPGT